MKPPVSWKAVALCGICALGFLSSSSVFAFNKSEHLGSSGRAKVNKVMAKKYSQDTGGGDGYTSNSNSAVNIGSKKAGTCTMNVGTSGDKGSKDVVVTSKEIINICK